MSGKEGIYDTKNSALLFGAVFLLVGFLGFVSAAAPDHMLFGIFHVNAAHNVIHLLSGAIALACGMTGIPAACLYFRIFGFVYGVVALLGFVQGDANLLGLVSNNMADVRLHSAIALAALALGFGVREAVPMERTV